MLFEALLSLLVVLAVSVLSGFGGAYVFWRWRLFGKEWLAVPDGSVMPVSYSAYEVRLTRSSSHGLFFKSLYKGDDLQKAKRVYNEAVGPARTNAELWTRGSHTASRKVEAK